MTSFSLSGTPTLGVEYWVSGGVQLHEDVLALPLLAWNHCLSSHWDDFWDPSILSMLHPR